jgi:aminoglycoside/choline kinase family phosphotransferase
VSERPPPPPLSAGLRGWLRAQGGRDDALVALAGDVSPRTYYRVPRSGGSAILAHYPAEIADALARFAASTALLEEVGVRVPRILAVDVSLGAMLLEDLGERTLYEWPRDWAVLTPWFEAALDSLPRLRALAAPRIAALNAPLDAALLARELGKTRDAFLEPRGLLVSAPERRAWDDFALALAAALGADEPVPCHRDFMARNLVPLAPGELAVLDHQDLRLGPPGYDLASLLNDSLFPPPELERVLLARAGAEAGAARRQYQRAAVQRGLKAVGTFAAFAQRGSPRHLPLIPATGARALAHLAAVPEGELLPAALRDRLARAFCYTD